MVFGFFLVVFYTLQGNAFADDSSCYSLKKDAPRIGANSKQSTLLTISENQVCIDWVMFQHSENYEDLNSVYNISAKIKTGTVESIFNGPELKFPFLRAIFELHRDFLRDPLLKHDLSNILLPLSFLTGFSNLGSDDVVKKLNYDSALWFPTEGVLKKHADMGIIRAEEMLANRLVVRSPLHMSKVNKGDFSEVSRSVYELYKKNSSLLSHSALVSGIYEIGLGDQDGLASIEKAVKLGNEEAMFWLGFLYLDGVHIPQNLEKSHYWLQQGSLHGSAESNALLALAYKFGTYGFFDIEKSYEFINDYLAHNNRLNMESANQFRKYDERIKNIYLSFVLSINEGSSEIIALEDAALKGFRPALDTLCDLNSFGPESLGNASIQNRRQRIILNRDRTNKWCFQAANKGIVRGAIRMGLLYNIPEPGGKIEMENVALWYLIANQMTFQKQNKINLLNHGKSELAKKTIEIENDSFVEILKNELGLARFEVILKEAKTFVDNAELE